MKPTIFTKLKVIIKRLLGKCVYGYVYLKNTIRKQQTSPSSKPHRRKNIFNFIVFLTERWRSVTIILVAFFGIYYGLGAAISAKINNSLDTPLITDKNNPRHTTAALMHVLKTQVDDSPWTPALPAIFPAAVLDNLPSFQLGAKDGVKYLVKRLSGYYNDKNLQEAGQLLSYPANIWLFSQTADEKLAPGSAKQYRKALAKLKTFAASNISGTRPAEYEFLYQLTGVENLLENQLNTLHKHVLEHHTDMLDFKADDLFYNAQGTVYTAYYMLSALTKDYQDMIVETGQYENMMTALGYLREASALAPLAVKNASPQDTFAANHLLYLGFSISRALNSLKTVYNHISLHSRGQLP